MNNLCWAIACWVCFIAGFMVSAIIMPVFIASKKLSDYEEEMEKCEK